MKKKRSTIELVVKHGLCTGCGTCAGVCPQAACEMVIDAKRGRFLPQLDRERCRHCGICYEVCPGHSVDFEALSAACLGDVPTDVALGGYLACYIGHAKDENVRYDGASGGLVTSLLAFALERGLIDGALVTRMRYDEPLRPEPFLARTRDDLLSAAGSKYCPVAAGTALREILRTEGRYAVVGLPCHIQGLRKAEQHLPTLEKRIRYRISIACSMDYSFRGTEHLLRSLGISPGDVQTLQYRGRGWPGGMTIRLKDGTERTVPLDEYSRRLRPYSLRRCTLCSDMFGELSDLSCGDAWIPEVMQTDAVGSSFVVSRTSEGEELLEHAASAEAIELSELPLRDLLASQGGALFKKRKLPARMRLVRLAGGWVPVYRQELLSPSWGDYVNMVKFYIARYALTGDRRILAALFRGVRRRRRAPLVSRKSCPPVESGPPARRGTPPKRRKPGSQATGNE